MSIYNILHWKRDTFKKCTLYKYLPYTVQCRSYSKKPVNKLYIYSTVLGAAIKCKQWDYSGKWDTCKKCKNYIEYICSVPEVWSSYENSCSGHQPTGIQCFMKWSKANILFFSDPLPRFTLPPSDREFNSATLAWRVSHQKWMTSKVKKAKLWIHSVQCTTYFEPFFYLTETYNLSNNSIQSPQGNCSPDFRILFFKYRFLI